MVITFRSALLISALIGALAWWPAATRVAAAEFTSLEAANAEIDRLENLARERLVFVVHGLRQQGDTAFAAGDKDTGWHKHVKAYEAAQDSAADPGDLDGLSTLADVTEFLARSDVSVGLEVDMLSAELVGYRESLLRSSAAGTSLAGQGLKERRKLAAALELWARLLPDQEAMQSRIAQMRAVGVLQGLAGDVPEEPGIFAALARAQLELGRLDLAANRPVEAESTFIAALVALAKSPQDASSYRFWQLAEVEDSLATALAAQQKWRPALAAMQAALTKYETLAKGEPGNAARRLDLASALNDLAEIHVGSGAVAVAIAVRQRLVAMLAAPFPAADQDRADRISLSAHQELAFLFHREKRTQDSIAEWRKARDVAERWVRRQPDDGDRQLALANQHWSLARAKDDARANLGRTIALLEALVADSERNGQETRVLAEARAELAALPP